MVDLLMICISYWLRYPHFFSEFSAVGLSPDCLLPARRIPSSNLIQPVLGSSPPQSAAASLPFLSDTPVTTQVDLLLEFTMVATDGNLSQTHN
jgi:hypothetical protein